ncbi:MAG TPA: lytic transglycosylase domain-containing protein, partial [Candidatus Binataceae bacterium]
KTLEDWDAFLVFAIKQLGETVGDSQFRDQLMSILLESRYRLVAALAIHPTSGESDPVRALFLDEWQKLHDAVRSAAKRGMLGTRSLEFLSFVSAGDALLAFDQAAPALGMRISAEDLRRLAHIMAPQSTADPLAFTYEEDPELRKLFTAPGAAPPLQSPGPIEESDVGPSALTTATPPAATPTTAAPAPAPLREPPTPTAQPTPASGSTSILDRMLRWMLQPLAPREAYATETASDAPTRFDAQLKEVGQRLKHVVVDDDNALRYREDTARLLEFTAERELAYESDLDPRWPPVYVNLVKSTAWQESCWRQFVRVNGRLRWLESPTGDIGLMQINKHVWRGFYRVNLLEWDALYNAGAGAEILMLMMRYVIAKPVVDPVPIADHLARSAYAAYNGGPDAYNRWRLSETPVHKQTDDSFWAKYQAISDGQSVDILACARRWGKFPGPLKTLGQAPRNFHPIDINIGGQPCCWKTKSR